MVAPEQEDGVFEAYLDCEDESQDLDGEAAAVDVIAEEDVLGGVEGASRIVVDDLTQIRRTLMKS